MKESINMKESITYGLDLPWSQIVDFLDEKFLDLMCKRLHVDREQISRVSFILSSEGDALHFFNTVEV